MITLLAFTVVVAIAVVSPRLTVPAWMERAAALLAARWAPLAVGLATSVIMAWVWGSLAPIPTVHDGAAYVLQARIYAALHWTAPGRPLPRFFEQYHVFVTPRLFSKYWPGHSLVLVPGLWLHAPALMPIMFMGITGAALFTLARRVANPLVALLASLLWISAPGVLQIATYLSETTSAALWVLGWLALLQWQRTGARRWLLCLAACVGWGGITRPLTWLLYAIPVGAVVLPRIVRRRAWSDLTWASAVIAACFGVVVVWCLHTTGQPLRAPYTLYTHTYLPDDILGFGVSGQTPLRPLNPDMQRFAQWVHGVHATYTVQALPHVLAQRVLAIGRDMWTSYRVALLPFVIFALVPMTAEVCFALVSSILLVLGYLAYAHEATWSVYYFEIQPVLAFVTALGIWRFARLAGAWLSHRPAAGERVAPASAIASMTLVALALVPSSMQAASSAHEYTVERTAYHRRFRDAVAELPAGKLIVFVRYAPGHSPHHSLITNEPDLTSARAWIVYDRGQDDVHLLQLAPYRTAYVYDDAHNTMTRLNADELARIPTPRAAARDARDGNHRDFHTSMEHRGMRR